MMRAQFTWPIAARRAASLLLVLLALCVRASAATSGSIVTFPRVIVDGDHDTVVQLSNVSNSQVFATCVLFDAGAGQQTVFELTLFRQQPTIWSVRDGRPVDATAGPTGFDPGLIPPVTDTFHGYLVCVEVDQSGQPISGNHLAGQETLKDLVSGDVAQYASPALLGNENNDGDAQLCLGGEPSDTCPNGAEYDSCPHEWLLNHFAEGATDPAAAELGVSATVHTRLTFLSCQLNFFSGSDADPLDVSVESTNELGQTFSGGGAVQPWEERTLDSFGPDFAAGPFGSTAGSMTITSPLDGFVVIGEQIHASDGPTTSAAVVPRPNPLAPGNGNVLSMPFGFAGDAP